MIARMVPIPKGALFYVSTGAHSDYSVVGVFRALEKIDVEALREKWLASHPEQRECYHFDDGAFFASAAHLMEPVDTLEWHLADYASAEDMNVSQYEAAALAE